MSEHRIPSLKLLMGFEAAARHGNFSRAADELHVTQSAISHQVQLLEEQVKQPLFRRAGRGVELTVAGEVLLRSVQRSMTVLRSGLGRIATYLDPGLVVLVCPAPLLHGWLQPRLRELETRLPELCLLLSVDESARFVDEIDVDIAIGERPILQPDLQEIPLLRDEWVMVANSELAARLAGVPQDVHHLHADLVCLEESLTGDTTAPLFLGPLARFRKRAIYDDARLLLDATLDGRGIACLPRLLANASLARGQLHVLPAYPRVPGATWWLSGVAEHPRSPIVGQVFDWLRAQGQ
ncbi:LysR family transcriptional regulator [Janthinobacterium sp. PLB04]|uniref:LysR family transcriptional regulator n=1 Tax=Janthinobacterium lividum TaxID=29581 RepID=A0AAJ4MY77_9BURK|nr:MULTISPECIES: LysR family transcriptional regulator [Janthinobacterium]KAB0324829.1 LysR family transcriptional regulator [Janthinobacterium lividum]QSX98936.1 LysR family transcriptional regulator [Janthinobacterium lividum]UGQ38947.1 LysR family transcriptional regulator [Janthinobacterium sp. PLB04]